MLRIAVLGRGRIGAMQGAAKREKGPRCCLTS